MVFFHSCAPPSAPATLSNQLHDTARRLNGAVLGPIIGPENGSGSTVTTSSIVVAEVSNCAADCTLVDVESGEPIQIVDRAQLFDYISANAEHWFVADGKTYLIMKK